MGSRYIFWSLIAGLIFLPRFLDLLVTINPDTCYVWLGRSATFYSALAEGNFSGTAISSHPGVLVAILAGAGLITGSVLTFGTPSPWAHMSDLACVSFPVKWTTLK